MGVAFFIIAIIVLTVVLGWLYGILAIVPVAVILGWYAILRLMTNKQS